ncbi:S-adenosylmethionine decarboxylase [Candidatus Azambacteria bacterium]|nr:S-adenosylmethionine decarboxylase [Candidatus Azambacteria bacterium]
MKNIETRVHRQRLAIEAHYTVKINREMVKKYLVDLAKELHMTIHPDLPEPLVTSATGKSNPVHDGYEGIIIWLESGAQIYVWEKLNFLTVDIYTCSAFDAKIAVDFTANFFKTSEIEHSEI